MYHSIHTEFIQTSLAKLLKDAVNASYAIGGGIEGQPLYEYIMQSLFLRLTGASEQKLKCIVWELATHDYNFRYEYTSGKKTIGEGSNFDDKNNVAKALSKAIQEIDKQYSLASAYNEITTAAFKDVYNTFNGCSLSQWSETDFSHFRNKGKDRLLDLNIFDDKGGINKAEAKDRQGNIIKSSLNAEYTNFVYKHRNRCAHNTLSYQHNLPTLDTLAKDDYPWHNYYYRFALLLVLDEIFIRLHKKYVEGLSQNTF